MMARCSAVLALILTTQVQATVRRAGTPPPAASAKAEQEIRQRVAEHGVSVEKVTDADVWKAPLFSKRRKLLAAKNEQRKKAERLTEQQRKEMQEYEEKRQKVVE